MKVLSGITNRTKDELLLHAGAFFVGLDEAALASKTALAAAMKTAKENETTTGAYCLGATRGGGTFVVGVTLRQLEADGMRGRVKGLEEIDDVEPKLTTTLLQITPDTMRLAMVAADKSGTGGNTKLTPRYDIKDSDYIDRLTWVGQAAQVGYVAITLKNALNISTAGITYTDKGEATLPVEFVGHTSGLEGMLEEEAPAYEIVYLTDAPTT